MADFISIDSTTWKSIPKDDPRDRVEAIVGDDKESLFFPQVKIQRWDNEVNFSVRLVTPDRITVPILDKEKIVWDSPSCGMEFSNSFRNIGHPENLFKFEYTIKTKLPSNQIRFSLESKGVEFYRQPTMNERHPSGYSDFFGREIISNKTQVFDAQAGEELANCDDDVPGGYVVFQAERKRNYVNGKLYRCGMVGLIYCPKIIDALGKWTYGDLDIDPIAKTYVVTIPQKFLDTATYPIRSNDTFGDETLGGAFTTISAACRANLSHTYAATAGDEITKYSIGCLGYDVGQTFDVAAYTFAGGVPVTRAGTPGTAPAVNGVAAYQDTGAVSHTLGSATYCLAVGNGNGTQRIAYTSSVGDHSRHTASSELPATWTEDGDGTEELSIYATYTPAGGGAVWIPRVIIF